MKILTLGQQNYQNTWDKMRDFTHTRDKNTEDELWIVEHPAVFTQGIASKTAHFLGNPNTCKIPIIKTDRGGQITYHGLGQLIIYCLIDIKRLGIGVKKMVSLMEISIIELLQNYDIKSHLKAGAPGVYVDNAKIAALGLKVKNGKTYHGLSLNIDMDLSPFEQINPCGYKGLRVTQMRDLTDNASLIISGQQLSKILTHYVTKH